MVYGALEILSVEDISPWVDTVYEISLMSIKLFHAIEDTSFPSLISLWKQLMRNRYISNQNEDIYQIEKKFIHFFSEYCEYSFCGHEAGQEFFQNLQDVTQKSFIKLTDQRYQDLHWLMGDISYNNIPVMLNSFLKSLSAISEQIKGVFYGGYGGISNPEIPNLLVKRISHFLLVVGYGFFKQDKSHYIADTNVKNYHFEFMKGYSESHQNMLKIVVTVLGDYLNFSKSVEKETSVILIKCYTIFISKIFKFLNAESISEKSKKMDTQVTLTRNESTSLGFFVERTFELTDIKQALILLIKKLLSFLKIQDELLQKMMLRTIRQMLSSVKDHYKFDYIESYKNSETPFVTEDLSWQNILNHQEHTQILGLIESPIIRIKYFKCLGELYLNCDYHYQIIMIKKIRLMVFEQYRKSPSNKGVIKCTILDLIGILASIKDDHVYENFIKVIYKDLRQLLENQDGSYLQDEKYVKTMLNLFLNLIKLTSMNKSNSQTTTVYFELITDSIRFVNVIVGQVTNYIENGLHSMAALSDFMADRSDLLKVTLKIYDLVMSSHNFQISVFHFFDNRCFIDFIVTNLKLASFLLPKINVRIIFKQNFVIKKLTFLEFP